MGNFQSVSDIVLQYFGISVCAEQFFAFYLFACFCFLTWYVILSATKKFPFRIRTPTVKRLPPYRDSIVA